MSFVERRGPGTIAVLFGPPGSGKGTQAVHISDAFHLSHISTGELLRTEVESGSELGREVGPMMAAGELVPDELIVRVIERRLRQDDSRRGVLLDGFPRTVPQAQALDAMLERQGRGVDMIICLDVPRQLLRERILKRALEEGRLDDTADAIETRFEVYERDTAPVCEHYAMKQKTRKVCVDGVGSVDEVRQRVGIALAEALGRNAA